MVCKCLDEEGVSSRMLLWRLGASNITWDRIKSIPLQGLICQHMSLGRAKNSPHVILTHTQARSQGSELLTHPARLLFRNGKHRYG
jgi:hypothetical protein